MALGDRAPSVEPISRGPGPSLPNRRPKGPAPSPRPSFSIGRGGREEPPGQLRQIALGQGQGPPSRHLQRYSSRSTSTPSEVKGERESGRGIKCEREEDRHDQAIGRRGPVFLRSNAVGSAYRNNAKGITAKRCGPPWVEDWRETGSQPSPIGINRRTNEVESASRYGSKVGSSLLQHHRGGRQGNPDLPQRGEVRVDPERWSGFPEEWSTLSGEMLTANHHEVTAHAPRSVAPKGAGQARRRGSSVLLRNSKGPPGARTWSPSTFHVRSQLARPWASSPQGPAPILQAALTRAHAANGLVQLDRHCGTGTQDEGRPHAEPADGSSTDGPEPLPVEIRSANGQTIRSEPTTLFRKDGKPSLAESADQDEGGLRGRPRRCLRRTASTSTPTARRGSRPRRQARPGRRARCFVMPKTPSLGERPGKPSQSPMVRDQLTRMESDHAIF